MNDYLAILLFYVPAGVANSFPPIANKIPVLNRWKTPLDFGKKYGKYPVFGKNKTWRGLITGTLAAGLSAWLLFPHLGSNSGNGLENFLIGCSLGLGALLGDAAESFFKRQRGIKSGEAWLFFDQLDFVVGAILFSLPFVRPTMKEVATVIVSYFVLHFAISYVGFLLKIKEDPFDIKRG